MLSFFSSIGMVLAIGGLVLPLALFAYFPDFAGKATFTVIFLLVVIERLWFSLCTSKEKNPIRVQQDWTFVAVGLAYTLLMYVVILEFYLQRSEQGYQIGVGVLAALMFVVSLALRWWSVHHLGSQWAIHVEGSEKADRHLVRTGPYSFVRHPIYLAAMIEVIAIPAFFNGFWSVLFAAVVCVPLIVARTNFEERNSLAIFGTDYEKYQKSTRAYWPVQKRNQEGHPI